MSTSSSFGERYHKLCQPSHRLSACRQIENTCGAWRRARSAVAFLAVEVAGGRDAAERLVACRGQVTIPNSGSCRHLARIGGTR